VIQIILKFKQIFELKIFKNINDKNKFLEKKLYLYIQKLLLSFFYHVSTNHFVLSRLQHPKIFILTSKLLEPLRYSLYNAKGFDTKVEEYI
jgi:hypothetical protein